MFVRKRKEYVTWQDINNHLKKVYSSREIVFREKRSSEEFGGKAFIVDRLKMFELSYNNGGTRCTYIFNKANNDTEDHRQITGMQAFNVLCRMSKVHKIIHSREEAPFSASPFLYYNPKYNGTRNTAICYDMNSAYSWAMLQDQPDTTKPPMQKKIGKGEVGFGPNGERMTEGYSIYVFKLIPSPFKRFVEYYYKKKKNPKNKAEKRKAKEYLNFSVGYLQNRNPYIRANIIGLCNDKIKSLIDNNTLYANTDSIVSLVERPELELGDEIGQWKVEHRGKFAYIEYSYQWNESCPSIRGKPKEYFPKGYDLLTDELPLCNNIYRFDRIKGEIVYEDSSEIKSCKTKKKI